MKYTEALVLREKYKHLIGTTNEQGMKIDDLLILPEDVSLRNRYLKIYMINDVSMPVAYQKDEDVVLWAIDSFHLRRDGILFYFAIKD